MAREQLEEGLVEDGEGGFQLTKSRYFPVLIFQTLNSQRETSFLHTERLTGRGRFQLSDATSLKTHLNKWWNKQRRVNHADA